MTPPVHDATWKKREFNTQLIPIQTVAKALIGRCDMGGFRHLLSLGGIPDVGIRPVLDLDKQA